MHITLIAATDINGALSRDGIIPWYLPSNHRYFMNLTLNKTVLMGRKTYESLKYGPFANRRNIVLTSQTINDPDIETAPTLIDALRLAKSPLYIIGGKSLFNQCFNISNCIVHTEVRTRIPDGDMYCRGFSFLPNNPEWDLLAEEYIKSDSLPYIRRLFFRKYG